MIRNTSMDWLNVFSSNYRQVTSVLPGNVLFLTHENRCISYRAIWFSSLFRCRHGHSWDIIHAAGTDKPILIVLSSIFLELKNIYKIINVFFRSARELFTFLRFDWRFSYSVYKTDDGVYCCVCSSHRICFYYILYTLYGESPPIVAFLQTKTRLNRIILPGYPFYVFGLRRITQLTTVARKTFARTCNDRTATWLCNIGTFLSAV